MFRGNNRRNILLLCLFLWIVIVVFALKYRSPLKIKAAKKESPPSKSLPDVSVIPPHRGFIVDTPGCKIPDVDPFDKSVRKFILLGRAIVCEINSSVTYTEGNIIRINRTAVDTGYDQPLDFCEYEPILRADNSDNEYSYGRRVQFKDDTDVAADFVRVACFGDNGKMMYANFHPIIRVRRQLERKVDKKHKLFLKNNHLEKPLNFLVIGVDSVSRLNYIRHMPRTRKYLLNNHHTVEMKGFNKVADNTYVNIVPMFTGKFVDELAWDERNNNIPFDSVSFLWKNLSQAGYRTLFAEDAPHIAIFNYDKGGFAKPPMDYYLRPFSLAMEDHGSVWNTNRDCVGSKLETEVVLDWVRDYLQAFRGKPHFAFAFLTRLTHEGSNRAGGADKPYHDFFQRITTDGLLNDTVIIFFSDHGMRFGPMRETYIGKLEERLPFLSISVPKWFPSEYPLLMKALEINANRLTTPFDLHETMAGLFTLKRDVAANLPTSRGMSLLSEVPDTRTCEDASILSHWCTCHSQSPVSPSDPTVHAAAASVVDDINRQLAMHAGACAVLTLNHVSDARMIIANEQVVEFKASIKDVLNDAEPSDKKNKLERFTDYLITFITVPGNAVFEATVRYSASQEAFYINGDISRINRYGDQSICIDYHQHKRFCFCQ